MIPLEKERTYEEFLDIDEQSNENLEFIDGRIYLLSAPSVIHQTVVTNLSTEFGIYFKGKKCRHYVAPFDVVLKDDEKTHRVQPDLTVICDKKGLGEQSYNGVPALVVEVLSPATASVDFIKKMGIYMNAGIKEYWIVSPQNSTVQIFILKENGIYSEPTMYSKNDIVKSETFEELKIKLSEIFQ
ncbi:Uma2 family endonuclease [Sedimentibacter hydroxybenzoicus DSM 7310]|uniref:Uma2 family endonuclease n=1 Tax=Sedimentibacter hydroxybenzoicus DSM 7310 TaxID=1123245 RepID=A0A974BKZ4_SEDHY|nr:Uma2 family endonuclease [Sedimentibacter hydroxybenzoicus]NYB75109.1 Uma2 family endonuclease [Sedimentibacter hydroxybenzoicus DSM 7310]